MNKQHCKYGFILWLLLTATKVSAADDTLSERIYPILEFKESIEHTTSNVNELLEEFKKTLAVAKELYEPLKLALKDLSDTYKNCKNTKDEQACDDFKIKQEKIQPLAHALMTENRKLVAMISQLEEQFAHKIGSNIESNDLIFIDGEGDK